jgi:hypothetical protein
LVTIVSGALSFSQPMFVIGSIITRGLRFLAVAWIFQKFGPSIAPVIEKRMGMVLIGVAVLLIAIIVFLKFAH